MRRWGDGERFLRRIADIRAAEPDATFRSSFILGYPGETERDHDLCSSSWRTPSSTGPASSPSPTRTGRTPPGSPTRSPPELALERLRECAELQDAITAAKRDPLVGEVRTRARGRARAGPHACTRRPRSTASCTCPTELPVGSLVDVRITGAEGPDLHGRPRRRPRRSARRCGSVAPVSDATHEHARRPPRLHLRAQRAGHPGQRGDRGPSPRRARLRRHARRVGGVVDQRRGRHRPRRQRRARWLHGPPPRHHPLGRLPRPAGRQGRASSARIFTLAAQGHLPWLPVILITDPRGRHAALPLLGRPPRRVDPGPQVGQGQDARAGLRDRHRASSRRWPTSTACRSR